MSLLQISGLGVESGSKKLLLDGVSFDLETGSVFAVLGPNGAGKSTLLKAIAGILPRQRISGLVKYQGSDLLSLSQSARARRVAYVGAELNTSFPISAHEVVLMGLFCERPSLTFRISQEDEDNLFQAMDLCGCWDLRDRMFDTLSGGERQRVALARALVQGARVLLLDESLSKMDLHHQTRMGNVLKSLAKERYGIVWVTHDPNQALRHANQGILLHEGRIIAEGKSEELLQPNFLQKIYPGIDAKLLRTPESPSPVLVW